MKKNKYIRCTIKDDDGIVELRGNNKELTMMVCIIVHNVTEALGIDIEKFCTAISEMTVNMAKDIEEDKKEEFEDEDYVF